MRIYRHHSAILASAWHGVGVGVGVIGIGDCRSWITREVIIIWKCFYYDLEEKLLFGSAFTLRATFIWGLVHFKEKNKDNLLLTEFFNCNCNF